MNSKEGIANERLAGKFVPRLLSEEKKAFKFVS